MGESAICFSKFNVDVAARGKAAPSGIGAVVNNDRGEITLVFLESVGVKEYNVVELWG